MNQYVGKTKNSPKIRFRGHLDAAKRGSKTSLSMAIRKYGAEVFDVQPLEEVSLEDMDLREQYHISVLTPAYNMTKGGDGGDTGMVGSKWINNGLVAYRLRCGESLPEGFVYGILESSKAKMKKGRSPFSPAACENMRQARLKFRHTEESKLRMSEVRKELWRQKKLSHP